MMIPVTSAEPRQGAAAVTRLVRYPVNAPVESKDNFRIDCGCFFSLVHRPLELSRIGQWGDAVRAMRDGAAKWLTYCAPIS